MSGPTQILAIDPPVTVVVVRSLSHVQLFATPWTAAHQASLSFTLSQSLLRFVSLESVVLSDRLILCHSLLLLPSVFPSIRVFSNESALHIRCFSISPINEYYGWFPLGFPGLISLQSNGLSRVFSSTTVLKHQFFGAQPSLWFQLSHPYMTTRNTIALTMQTFVGKVLCFFICCLGLS